MAKRLYLNLNIKPAKLIFFSALLLLIPLPLVLFAALLVWPLAVYTSVIGYALFKATKLAAHTKQENHAVDYMIGLFAAIPLSAFTEEWLIQSRLLQISISAGDATTSSFLSSVFLESYLENLVFIFISGFFSYILGRFVAARFENKRLALYVIMAFLVVISALVLKASGLVTL